MMIIVVNFGLNGVSEESNVAAELLKNCVQTTTFPSPVRNQHLIVVIYPTSFGIFGFIFIQLKLQVRTRGLGTLRPGNPSHAAKCAGL